MKRGIDVMQVFGPELGFRGNARKGQFFEWFLLKL